MAIVITADYTTKAWGNTTNTTMNRPANVVDGDFLLAFLILYSSAAVTPPTGWTLIVAVANTSGCYTHLYYKRASSEGASWVWTHANTSTSGFVQRLTGVVASGDPEDCTRSTATAEGTSISCASITTATAGACLCQALGATDTTGLWSGETLTERIDVATVALASDLQASAGASGAKAATHADGYSLAAVLIALRPAAGGGPYTGSKAGVLTEAGAYSRKLEAGRTKGGIL